MISRTSLTRAWRSLARDPLTSAAAVFCLVLGLGANATMVAVIDQLLLRPPSGVTEPSQLRRLAVVREPARTGAPSIGVVSARTFGDLQARFGSSLRFAAFVSGEMGTGRGSAAQRLRAEFVSPEYFGVLGVRALRGRLFAAEGTHEHQEAPTVIISERLWRGVFDRRADAVGAPLRLDNTVYTVGAIVGGGFTGVGVSPADVWLPLAALADARHASSWQELANSQPVTVVVRSPTSEAIHGLTRDATAIFQARGRESRTADSTARVVSTPLQDFRAPAQVATAAVLVWLGGVSVAVLVLACVNVAMLLLTRAVHRRPEAAVQLAMGASPARIVRMQIADSLVISVCGAALSTLFALLGVHLARRLLPGLEAVSFSLHWRVLLYMAIAAVVCGLLTSILPAADVRRTDIRTLLTSAHRGGDRARHRLTRIFAALQIALSVVLLSGAGAFIASLAGARRLDLGIDADRVLVARADFGAAGFSLRQGAAIAEEMRQRAEQIPNYDMASLTLAIPFQSFARTRVMVPGHELPPSFARRGVYANRVTPEFFATVGIPVLAGRSFDSIERTTSGRALLINQTMARLVWPGENVLGKCVSIPDESVSCARVIGVVGDSRRLQLIEDTAPQVYLPLAPSDSSGWWTLLVRAHGTSPRDRQLLQRELQGLRSDMPYVHVTSLSEIVAPQFRPWVTGATLFSAFGILALILAASGIYGLMASETAHRRHELAVRVALGAPRRRIVGMIASRAIPLVTISVLVGGYGAVLALRRLAPLMLRGAMPDNRIVVAAIVSIVCAVVVAVMIPAWSASRREPAAVLRG